MEFVKWNSGKKFGCGHDTLFDFYKRNIDLSLYYKWTFVRNPWDRILSVYLADPHNLYIPSFSQFIEILYSKKHLFPKTELSWSHKLNFEPIKNIIHFMPMNLMLKINGNINIDFIGKFENIQNDWFLLQKKLKLNPTPLLHHDPYKKGNKKLHIDYSKFYNKNLIDLVGEIYEEDINLFNYKSPNI